MTRERTPKVGAATVIAVIVAVVATWVVLEAAYSLGRVAELKRLMEVRR